VFLRWPVVAFAVLVLSALTDVLDGYVARRFGLATPTGAAVDPVTDKLFVLTVVSALVLQKHLRFSDVLLLSTREIGELPLVVWFGTSARARKSRADYPKANWAGKAATVLQFGTISAALFRIDGIQGLVWLTAIGGALAAASYWKRALDRASR
jgi:phosphatidylglycerophosphate synthase